MGCFRRPCSDFGPAPIELTRGLTTPSVKLLTTVVNAAPMTTATDRSTILPRARNSLNPLSISEMSLLGSDRVCYRSPAQAWPGNSMQGQRYRLAERRACHRVRHASRKRNQDYAVSFAPRTLLLPRHEHHYRVGRDLLAHCRRRRLRFAGRRGEHVDHITDPHQVDKRA